MTHSWRTKYASTIFTLSFLYLETIPHHLEIIAQSRMHTPVFSRGASLCFPQRSRHWQVTVACYLLSRVEEDGRATFTVKDEFSVSVSVSPLKTFYSKGHSLRRRGRLPLAHHRT